MTAQPTVLDLFCGSGGLSLGFLNAGFAVVRAVDIDRAAVDTYRKNIGPHARQDDLRDATDLPLADIIIGGPPCQGFSSAGLRRAGDTRNSLVRRFADIISALRPRAFLFENVEGFLTGEDGAFVLDLLSPLVEAGYRIHLRKINAANYGVPQHRKRVIALGGLGWSPRFPDATHSAFGAPGAALAGRHLPQAPSMLAAIHDLPAASSTPPGTPHDHWFRPLAGIDLDRARMLEPGQRMRDLPDHLWHESYRRRAFRRVRDGMPTERRGGAPVGLLRLRPDEPSKAITSGARTEFLHPLEQRNVTLRECARLQTFPDSFVFMGTLAQRAQLIGDAVPPRLAHAFAISLLQDVKHSHPIEGGALLTFSPTLSVGLSPALRSMSERVASHFSLRAQDAEQMVLWP